MGFIDAFSAEDRVEITVAQLIKLIDERARAESNFNMAMAMMREEIDPEKILRVFNMEKKEG